MNTLHAQDTTSADWTPSSFTIDFKRKTAAVSGNNITLDAPVVDPIDPTYATGTRYNNLVCDGLLNRENRRTSGNGHGE